MKMKRKIYRTAAQFRIKPTHIKRIQNGVYKVATKKGRKYCLKQIRCSTPHLKWIDRSLRRLTRRGFKRFAWRHPHTASGKKLFIKYSKNIHPFILTPWIRGRWPSPTSLRDMAKCGKTLAKFHRCGRKLPKVKSSARFNMIGHWPNIFQECLDRLQSRVAKAERRDGTGLDSFLQKNGSEMIHYAKESIRMLQESKYEKACRKARKKCTLCHGDGGPTNFIKTSKGLYLIDFETLRCDLRAYDLYRVIYNSCKDHDWNVEIAEAILAGYHSVSKLKKTDIDLLNAWLRFPYRMSRSIDKYDKSSSVQKEIIFSDIKGYLRECRRITVFLQQLDRKGKYR